jgi:hypothetical protein
MVQAYFEDMAHVLTRLRAFALPGASLWMVVSTSAYAGVEIPVDLILADIGSDTGWNLREVVVLRHLRSSGQHWRTIHGAEPLSTAPLLRESVVILDT